MFILTYVKIKPTKLSVMSNIIPKNKVTSKDKKLTTYSKIIRTYTVTCTNKEKKLSHKK